MSNGSNGVPRFRDSSNTCKNTKRVVSILFMTVLVVGPLIGGAMASSVSAPAASKDSGGSVGPYGQTYQGVLVGESIWENSTFPFQTYASTSKVLAMPAVNSWLATHGYWADELRPYLSLYPSVGNPYDFAEGWGTVGGVTYYSYQYIVPNSPNGTVVSVEVHNQTVGEISTYDTIGPSVAQFNTGENANSYTAVGHQTEDASLSGSNAMLGAVYNTEVFSDLSSPSSCNSVCWYWGNWIGASTYSWVGSEPSSAYFFQAIVGYWGGNLGELGNCNGTYSSPKNCVFFEYVKDGGALTNVAPLALGGWTTGNTVVLQWAYATESCAGPGGADNFVTQTITDSSTGNSESYTLCMPNISYSQFLEERPTYEGYITQEPEFSTHDFTASLVNSQDIPVNSGSYTWKITMVDEENVTIVSSTTLNNGASSSSWSDSWLSSTYP